MTKKKSLTTFILAVVMLAIVLPLCACDNSYRVKFNSRGGSSVSSKTVVPDKSIDASPIPRKDGYAFMGWYDNPELSGEAVTFPYTPIEDTTLYASWLAATPANSFTYTVERNGVTITKYIGSAAVVVIPSSLEGKHVTSIENDAFCNCISLTNVTIPSSVTSIGIYAFGDCSSLTSITISSGVMSIGAMAFYDCSSLTSVTIPSSVTSIGNYAFGDCISLTNVTLPNGVTSIGGGSFESCFSLTSITIPSGVTSIGRNAFFFL